MNNKIDRARIIYLKKNKRRSIKGDQWELRQISIYTKNQKLHQRKRVHRSILSHNPLDATCNKLKYTGYAI